MTECAHCDTKEVDGYRQTLECVWQERTGWVTAIVAAVTAFSYRKADDRDTSWKDYVICSKSS